MKKNKSIFVITGLISAMVFMSFTPKKNDKKIEFDYKGIEKSVAKISDKLYVGKYEVTNLQFREYLYYLTINGQIDIIKNVKPDTLNWRNKNCNNEPMVELYFRHPAYANYPVVNVSYEAANSYCEWLTNEYNKNSKKKFKKVKFRLPTITEWEFAASGGIENNNYPWGNSLLVDNKYMCNYIHIGDENLHYDTISKKIIVDYTYNKGIVGPTSDMADITAPVQSYNANKFGLYNTSGNVSEMVIQKGISKGGSWKNVGGDVRIKSQNYYVKSATDLGFRYFMEIIEL